MKLCSGVIKRLLKNTNLVVANFSLREKVVIFGNNQRKNSLAKVVGYRFSIISKCHSYNYFKNQSYDTVCIEKMAFLVVFIPVGY